METKMNKERKFTQSLTLKAIDRGSRTKLKT